MFNLEWFDKNRQEWLIIDSNDSNEVLQEVLETEHGTENAKDPKQFQIRETGKRRTQKETFGDLQDDSTEVAGMLTRMANILKNTTNDSTAPALEDAKMCKLQGQLRSMYHEVNSLMDDFYSWHNDMVGKGQ